MKNFDAGEKSCWMQQIVPGRGPLVWLMAGGRNEELVGEIMRLLQPAIENAEIPSFALAGLEQVNWDEDYAPWPLITPQGRRFGCGAGAQLTLAEETLWPAIAPQTDGRIFAVGYSLGGLSALYFAGLTDKLAGCASCSGSLWYPGFTDWLRQHRPCRPVYLSLGGKEKNTRDPLMARVEECTREAYELFRPHGKTVFVHEPGGHFHGTAQRLAHAIEWLLRIH